MRNRGTRGFRVGLWAFIGAKIDDLNGLSGYSRSRKRITRPWPTSI